MRIGILGGTFNPIHAAHIQLAKAYYEVLKLDKLILIPTFTPPHKIAEDLVSAGQRLAMCELAAEGIHGLETCGYEIEQQGKSYTYLTLRHLSTKYPGAEFFLIMGADMFLTVQDWKRPDELFKMAVLCAAPREYGETAELHEHAAKLEQEGARCVILDIEPVPLSSTEVRAKIKAGADVSALLDGKVLRYIRENKLYGAK